MELATALMWTLRITLPIILFCVYHRLFHSSSSEHSYSYPGPTKNAHARGKILARRKFVDPDDKPESLGNLCLKSQAEAPELFVSSGRPGRGGGGARRDDREKRADRGDRGGERGGERGEKRERRDKKIEKKDDDEDKENEAPVVQSLSSSEEKMHLESLLNYVAFNKRAQQRTFLPEEGMSPPPPPKRLRPGAPLQGPGDAEISGTAAEKANAEAQMVLRGAISFKAATVAKDLYEHFMDKQVEINESTFTLMIEGCVLASDLKSASDFLMKMETSGYCPEADLLDKVMDLYTQQKSQREKQVQPAAEASEGLAPPVEVPSTPATEPAAPGPRTSPRAAGEEAAGASPEGDGKEPAGHLNMAPAEESSKTNLKLSSDAPIFVPSFMPAPLPPSTTAIPANDPNEEGEIKTSLRTRLVASAKPFEPKFNLIFDPKMYTWTVDQPEDGGKGDDQGKGKKGGDGKGEANDGAKGYGKDGKGKSKGGKEGKSGGKCGKSKDGTDEPNQVKKPVAGLQKWKPKV